MQNVSTVVRIGTRGATGSLSAEFNYQIAATNYPTSFFSIGLPLGLSFDPASGGIFGIPSVTGSFNVTLRAINGGGTGSASLSLARMVKKILRCNLV